MPEDAPAIWIDGVSGGSLSLPDRGLDFGDGLFETLLLYRGRPAFVELHLGRLSRGLERLGFPGSALALAESCLFQLIGQLGNVHTDCAALRLTLTRGAGPRGYRPPVEPQPRVVISVSPLPSLAKDCPLPLTLGLAELRWAAQPRLAGIKHLNRLEQVLVAAESASAAVDEMVVLDSRSRVCSLGAANLFLVEGNKLITPQLRDCGIAGTRRQLICEKWGAACGYAVEETDISVQRLEEADEVFCCNSLRGVQPIGSFLKRRWQKHHACKKLYRHYLEVVGC